jgi:hypothetical protein
MNWIKLPSKHFILDEHAISSVDTITEICDILDKKSFHFNAIYISHKRFGEKVHTYRRNKSTNWYIVYNLDQYGNIYIQLLNSNHNTKSK